MKITDAKKTLLSKETPAMKAMGFGTMFQNLQGLADNRTSVGVVDGVNDDVVDTSEFDPVITEVIAVLAITKATGAAAAKLLQAETTDYTFADGVFTCIGDKSALTLIIIYK
jgi:hypothetical protein